jgi:hypothetical protein
VAPNVIDLKIKSLQRWTLRQDSGHNVSPVVVDVIGVGVYEHAPRVVDETATPDLLRLLHRILREDEPAECLPRLAVVDRLDGGLGRTAPHEGHLVEEEPCRIAFRLRPRPE